MLRPLATFFVSCRSKYILDIYLSCTGQMILPTLLYFSIVTANQNVTKCNIRLYNYNSGHLNIQIWQTIKGSTHFGDSTNVLLMKYPEYLTSAVIVKCRRHSWWPQCAGFCTALLFRPQDFALHSADSLSGRPKVS